MKKSSDAYWDELGVTWCAIDPNASVIASRLQARLRRQSQWMAVALVIGLLFGAAGLLLGLGTIGIGFSSRAWNFVTRGVAIIAMSAILMFAVWPLQAVRSLDAARALSEMLDLAIDHSQKTLSLIRAGLYCCVIAAVFGLVGTAIRTHLGRPPKMSPIVDLVMLGLIALVLFLYDRHIRVELRKYRALRQALAVDAEA
jgi:hypothetical protein